jgi:putative DNA primase/helicase
MLHLIAGVPEAGKTTIALSHVATLSSGARWPDGTASKPGNVLMWTGEDSPAQTIKPRLVQMGADCNRIWIVTGQPDENGKIRPFNPGTDLPSLRLSAEEIPGGVDLLIIDPIVAVIGGKLDNSNNAGHREKLQPLVDFATDLNCAVLGITHFTKGTIGKDPCDRVTGSLAFGAVARIITVATKNKQGDPGRMFLMAKNNLTDTSGGFGYTIIGSPLYEDPKIIASRKKQSGSSLPRWRAANASKPKSSPKPKLSGFPPGASTRQLKNWISQNERTELWGLGCGNCANHRDARARNTLKVHVSSPSTIPRS